MAAFREAADVGAQFLELDVRLTHDQHLVVFHDRTLRRTTGARGTVQETSLAALRHLDAGAWFSARWAGERIPMLGDVLEQLSDAVGIIIEVKTEGERRPSSLIAHRLLETLHGRRLRRRIIVSSFDHRFLRELRRSDKHLTLGVLAHPVRHLGRRPSVLAARCDAAWYFCSRSLIRRRDCEDAHAHGVRAGVYTVNRLDHLATLRRFGVDLVFTNYPAAFLRALAQHGGHS